MIHKINYSTNYNNTSEDDEYEDSSNGDDEKYSDNISEINIESQNENLKEDKDRGSKKPGPLSVATNEDREIVNQHETNQIILNDKRTLINETDALIEANNEIKENAISEMNNEIDKHILRELNETIINPFEEQLNSQIQELCPSFLSKIFPIIPENFELKDIPLSYTSNKNNENTCLEHIKNFDRQYKILYKDRKPLLLYPKNEYGIEKYICTYLNPVKLSSSEMCSWEEIASFVADFLQFVPLIPSTELPKRIVSSTNTIKIQKATSFEFSILLCSYLLGVGYDSYVVVGYATRECCLLDLSRTPSPYKKLDQTAPVISSKPILKYNIKSNKIFKSQYLLLQEVKSIREAEDEKLKNQKQKDEADWLKIKPKKDPLFGLRYHSWVLIKKGRKNIENDFFIEPTSGHFEPLKTDKYLGIENIFNDEEHWINMQDCSKGINKMSFNFYDLSRWEPVLPTELVLNYLRDSKQGENIDPRKSKSPIFFNYLDNDENETDLLQRGITVPHTWLKRFRIDKLAFDKRFPDNSKLVQFYKSTVERFSPGSQNDGMYLRIRNFKDYELFELEETLEYFTRRLDKLYLTKTENFWKHNFFIHGQINDILERQYKINVNENEKENTFIFNSDNRIDKLEKRKETANQLEEWYINRKDKLRYLCCVYEKKRLIISNVKEEKHIEKLIKQFDRNPDKPYYKDVKEIIFYLKEEKYFLKYHKREYDITYNTRVFFKPAILNDGNYTLPFYNDTHIKFEGIPNKNNRDTNLKLYDILVDLIKEEEMTIKLIRSSERESIDFIKTIETEKDFNFTDLSLFDTIRNLEANEKRLNIERSYEHEQNKIDFEDLDYLAPYFIKYNIEVITTREKSLKIRESCLKYFKKALIEKAAIIQRNLDGEIENLNAKFRWYQFNNVQSNLDEVNEYIEFCKKSTFKIHILENLMKIHKERAPEKYIALDRKLRHDSRFNIGLK